MLKKWTPFNNSTRNLVTIRTSKIVTTSDPYKPLTQPLKSSNGRDGFGHISSRHRSAGHKKLYRVISFARKIFDIEGTIETIEYDPNRNCYICLVGYIDSQKEYILCPTGVKVGDKVTASRAMIDFNPGNCMPLITMPVGVSVHNVETTVGLGGKFARSAGSFATLISKDEKNAMLRMPSGEIRVVPSSCFATIGVVSNSEFKNTKKGKAGRNRWLGRRPSVRGVAMNPVDHPHGGGEGKSGTAGAPVSPWGKQCKGLKTRKNKRTTKFIVRGRKG